jgi:hypothetical protein
MTGFARPDPDVLAWIDQSYKQGEPKHRSLDHSLRPDLRFECYWCAHAEHGLKCGDCRCPTSYDHRDETWRPARQYTEEWKLSMTMDTLGCDGWVARFLHRKGPHLKPPHRRSDVEQAMYGRPA